MSTISFPGRYGEMTEHKDQASHLELHIIDAAIHSGAMSNTILCIDEYWEAMWALGTQLHRK